MLICCGVQPAFNEWVPAYGNFSGEWSYYCPVCLRVGWREDFDPLTSVYDEMLHLPMAVAERWFVRPSVTRRPELILRPAVGALGERQKWRPGMRRRGSAG